MRFTLRIACLALSATGLCVSPAAAQFCGITVDCDWPVPDVAHWTFNDVSQTNGLNGNAEDVINGNTAIWQGNVASNTPTAGLIGTGASQTTDESGSPSSAEHYQVDLPQLDGSSAFTLSIWFNQNVDSNNNSVRSGLITSREVTGSLPNRTGDQATGNGIWGVAIRDNGSPRGLDARIANNGDNTNLGAGDLLPDGVTAWDGIIGNVVDEWHHVAMTWDGVVGDRKLYYDGQLIGEGLANPIDIGSITDSGFWKIGDDNCCNSREFSGTLDDTGVWSTALSATDVAQIYNAGLEGIDLSKVEPPQPGDVDLDEDVDLTDFAAIQTNFFTETGATRIDGDLTGGGAVDWADFREWKDNFPFPTASSNAVPEPTSAMIACLAMLSLGACRKRA